MSGRLFLLLWANSQRSTTASISGEGLIITSVYLFTIRPNGIGSVRAKDQRRSQSTTDLKVEKKMRLSVWRPYCRDRAGAEVGSTRWLGFRPKKTQLTGGGSVIAVHEARIVEQVCQRFDVTALTHYSRRGRPIILNVMRGVIDCGFSWGYLSPGWLVLFQKCIDAGLEIGMFTQIVGLSLFDREALFKRCAATINQTATYRG